MKRVLLALLTYPADLFALGILLGLRVCRQGEFEAHEKGMFVLRGEPDSRVAKHWHFSTTLGPHCIYLDPFASDLSFQHELKHTSQAAGVSCAWAQITLATGLAGFGPMFVFALCVWPLCWLLVYGGASLKAWLAGEHSAYLGNEFEQQAYAYSNTLRDEKHKTVLLSLGDKWLADADRYANARVLSDAHDYDSKTDGIIQTYGICSFELRDAMRKR